MKRKMYVRLLSVLLLLCMIVSVMPIASPIEAKAVSGIDNLTCSGFISDATAQTYIDVMMRYYLNNNSKLRTALDNGKNVIFMFEGGSDKYWVDGSTYANSAYDVRDQAVCIVVQKDSSGNAYIAYSNEYCSSIPGDPTWCTYGVAHSGSVTILDGIYSMYTTNHTGPYAALQLSMASTNYMGYYTPLSDPDGYKLGCSGINVHTRAQGIAAGSDLGYAWSEGCQVIDYGDTMYNNDYNGFMQAVTGITWNPWISYYSSPKQLNTFASTGTDMGYFVVDRQLGLMNPSGTEYGSGSLIALYNTTALSNITEFSRNARANADFTLDYMEKCTRYPSCSQIQAKNDSVINTYPCADGTNGSETIYQAKKGDIYTCTGVYLNHAGNYWLEVITNTGGAGYVYSGSWQWKSTLKDDMKLSGVSAPSAMLEGSAFSLSGTLAAQYLEITDTTVAVRPGLNNTGSDIFAATDTVTNNKYSYAGSTVNANTKFSELAAGEYTMIVRGSYKSYFVNDSNALMYSYGTLDLQVTPFMVISGSSNQAQCSHSYKITYTKAPTCTAAGSGYKSCAKCGLIVQENFSATGHNFGDWTEREATCTVDGERSRSCSKCGQVEKEVFPAGHDYVLSYTDANCSSYATYEYTCTQCGDYFKRTAQEMTTTWLDSVPQGMDESQFITKTQYRYADCTSKSVDTSSAKKGTVTYISSWPSGFKTSDSNYAKYNQTKVTASETDTTKVVINSDEHAGWLWWHWCDTTKTSSWAYETDPYHTFHVYFDTDNPEDYTCDTFDYSYKTAHSSCSNATYWFPIEVFTQTYTTYNKVPDGKEWGEWSDWSDAVVSAIDNTRKIETRTVYQLKSAELGRHNYTSSITRKPGCTETGIKTFTCIHCNNSYTETINAIGHKWLNGICSNCGNECAHNFEDNVCAVCGIDEPELDYYLFGWINGEDYACEGDYANMGEYKFADGKLVVTFEEDSYVGVKTSRNVSWYFTKGWLGFDTTSTTLHEVGTLAAADKLYVPGGVEVTFTLVVNPDNTLTLSYEAAQKAPTLELKYPTLLLEDEIIVNVYFAMDQEVDLSKIGLLTWEKQPDVVGFDTADEVIPGAVLNPDGLYSVNTQAIPAKNLGDTIYFCIYVQLEDGSYVYSKQVQYSPKQFAYSQLSNNSVSTETKSLMVAMLNYGAQAQIYFDYKTDALVNQELTSAQNALVRSYSSSMMDSIDLPDASKAGPYAATGGFSSKYPTVSLEGAFAINYYFTTSYTPDANVMLFYWTEADYQAAGTLSPSNATGRLSLEGSNVFSGMVEGIPAQDLDDTIYVVAGYRSGGVSYCTGVLPYSIGAFCNSQASTGSEAIKPLASAIAVYGYYAKAYFTSL